MANKTERIKFNVNERGRKYLGKDRNFDTVTLAALINSNAVQEQVKHRDLLGYFGHWPRQKFGMDPGEGGIVNGKHVSIEPAIVTTYLHAYPDGTIEHETEFLDTASGKLAFRMHSSKVGGFSSAIQAPKVGGKHVPTGFFGFDYVKEPNFSTNRGYGVALDSINSEDDFLLFDECANYSAMIDAANHLYEATQAAFDLQSDVLLRVQAENEELLMMLAAGKKQEPIFDGIMGEAFGGGEDKFAKAERFKNIQLAGYQRLEPAKSDADGEQGMAILDRRFGA